MLDWWIGHELSSVSPNCNINQAKVCSDMGRNTSQMNSVCYTTVLRVRLISKLEFRLNVDFGCSQVLISAYMRGEVLLSVQGQGGPAQKLLINPHYSLGSTLGKTEDPLKWF